MSKFKFYPYVIKVKKKRKKEYYSLKNVEGVDMYYFFHDALKSLLPTEKVQTFQKLSTTFSVHSFNTKTNLRNHRVMSGIIQSGDYGYEYPAYNVNNGNYIKVFRKENISELMPFFYFINLDILKKVGLLILQSFKDLSTKSILEKYLGEVLAKSPKKLAEKIKIEIHPIITTDLIKKLSKGRLLQFKLIKYTIGKDVSDQVKMIENPDEIYEERVFKVKRSKRIKLVKNWTNKLVNNKVEMFASLEQDEIKFVIENENGSQETLSTNQNKIEIKEFMNLEPSNSNLELGHPKETYLEEKAEKYSQSLLPHLRI